MQERKSPLKRDMAVGCFTAVAFFFAVRILPVLGLGISIFTPAPIILYRRKWGRKDGGVITAAILATIVIFMMGTRSLHLMPLLFIYGTVGILLGEAMDLGFSLEGTVALVVAGSAVITASGLLLSMGLSPSEALVSMKKGLAKSIDQAHEVLREINPKRGYTREQLEGFTDLVMRTSPALFVNGIVFLVWANLLVAKRLFARHNLQVYPPQDLTRWRMPEWAVWPAIGSGFVLWLTSGVVEAAGMNVVVVMVLLYFFQGLAIVAYYFEVNKLPPLFRIMGYSVIVIFQQFLVPLLSLAGLFDTWFDFRRLKPREAGAGSEDNGGQ